MFWALSIGWASLTMASLGRAFPVHLAGRVYTGFNQMSFLMTSIIQWIVGSLLDADLLGEMTREHSVGEDKTLLTRTRFGLGCMLDQSDVANATYGMGAKAFGHPGAGGSSGFADPERDLAFGFVTNNLGPFVLMDPRAQKLARQIADCI